MFVRHRTKWASGLDDNWTYFDLTTYYGDEEISKEEWEKNAKNYIEEYVDSEWNWSDKYRGAEYEVMERAPMEWYVKKIKSLQAANISNNKLVMKYIEEGSLHKYVIPISKD